LLVFLSIIMTVQEEIKKLQERREMAVYQHKITTTLVSAIPYEQEISEIDRKIKELKNQI